MGAGAVDVPRGVAAARIGPAAAPLGLATVVEYTTTGEVGVLLQIDGYDDAWIAPFAGVPDAVAFCEDPPDNRSALDAATTAAGRTWTTPQAGFAALVNRRTYPEGDR